MKNTVEKKQSSGSIDYVLTSQTYLKQADFIYNIKDILFMLDKNIQCHGQRHRYPELAQEGPEEIRESPEIH